MRYDAEDLARDARGTLIRRSTRPIAGAFLDSRAPRADALFVPIGAARDGHDFLGAAVAGGASAVLVAAGREPPPGDITVVEVADTTVALGHLAARARDRIAGPVVAISGSNGKTTTRAMVAAVLRVAHPQLMCTRGNLNNHLGVPLTLLDEPHDASAAVIELGMSAPGENDRLAAIVRPTIAVVTSVAIEHLEFMGSLEAIAAAEAEPLRYVPREGAIVVPGDEPLLRPHLPATGPRVLPFAAGPGAVVEVVEVELGERTRARLRWDDGTESRVDLAAFGAHNARNAAAALAIARWLGIPMDAAIEALAEVTPVGDRGRVHVRGPHLVIADCYNANPGSMDAAVDSLARLRAARNGPLIAVLGDMLELGPTAADLHAEVGRRCAAAGLDLVVACGPLSRELAEAARRGGVEAVHVIDDPARAADIVAERLAQAAGPGAVLVKGSRGMRLERVVERLLAGAS